MRVVISDRGSEILLLLIILRWMLVIEGGTDATKALQWRSQ